MLLYHSLEEGGQTALGPALLLSVTIAKAVPGSKVIVCTDGMANIGLGSLDVGDDEAAYEQASAFYKDVGTMATEAGLVLHYNRFNIEAAVKC